MYSPMINYTSCIISILCSEIILWSKNIPNPFWVQLQKSMNVVRYLDNCFNCFNFEIYCFNHVAIIVLIIIMLHTLRCSKSSPCFPMVLIKNLDYCQKEKIFLPYDLGPIIDYEIDNDSEEPDYLKYHLWKKNYESLWVFSSTIIVLDSERSDECIDFTMIITSRSNASISNFGGSFRWKSEYHWCIIEIKSKHFPTVFKKIEINKKK
ncbi:hypothetical protein AGLY_015256 [Aphis glycines]|uniref:Uncharacterized protein n=1 Tax=Aphis glycines TaxID=307491 RepID=A0A6G0T2T5_APHGL|nr:hypothetical protein AGLY_015256 [Aphis glycines]